MQPLTTWLNYLVRCLGCALLLLHARPSSAQTPTLSLQRAFLLAEQNYPLAGQKDLAKQTEQLNQRNFHTGYLPQISLHGQASYQSDVTSVDIPIPNVKLPEQKKDQYRIYADISQQLYDGGFIRDQKEIQELNTKVEERKVDVELTSVKARVNALFFSILHQQQLLAQVDLLAKDIQAGIEKVRPQVENGTLLRSNLLVLEAQKLQTEQRKIEIRSTKQGLLSALATVLKTTINENTILEKPAFDLITDTTIARPELGLYRAQMDLLKGQQNLVDARNKPKISAFFQPGFGRPALNLLSTNFDSYYTAGIRINWSLGNLYNSKRDKQLLEVSQRSINLQKETFVLNTQSQLAQQAADIAKYHELIAADQRIIEVRQQISAAARAQLENAVITSNDYLREVNAEDQARQNLIIHQIQLLQARATYAVTAGKL